MRRRRSSTHWLSTTGLVLTGVLALFTAPGGSTGKDDFPPVSLAELAMKDNPQEPGGAAMILDRDELADDTAIHYSLVAYYSRVKIFTEEGKKYANIEIPFFKDLEEVKDIRARTVHPDGSVVEFDGKVLEKTVVKSGGLKYLAKTFTLPDVQPGSIIEYKYNVFRYSSYKYGSRWTLQSDLFIQHERFALRPYPTFAVHWNGAVAPGSELRHEKGQAYLDMDDVPAFQEEDYLPPETEIKPHIDYYYSTVGVEAPDVFWRRVGTTRYEAIEKFTGKPKEAAQVVAQAVSPGDPPETKLRKLYARTQQIRNLSFERQKTEKEEKREKLKEIKSAADVLKNGYGWGNQLNHVFVALARAAGFDASAVLVGRRDRVFFNREVLNESQLNDMVVSVRSGSQEWYLDPATRLCSFGLLPWSETNSSGIRLDKNGGTFVTTPMPKSADALTERKASLQLDSEGNLSGKLQVSFSGLEALRRRLDALQEDDAGRQKDLEDEIKGWLPAGASVEISAISGWDTAEGALVAETTVRIPNLGASTGRRILLPLAVFESNQQNPFSHLTRIHPIYFHYPYQDLDDVTLELPAGYQVETLPAAHQVTPAFGRYEISASQQSGTARVQRRFVMEGIYFKTNAYPDLRAFFSQVKAGDEEQAVFKTATPAAN